MESNKVHVAEYLSVAVLLAEQCGLVIREVYESGKLNVQSKGIDGPVTIADLRVQKTIEECLAYHFPNLPLKGEESAKSLESVTS